MSEFMDIEDNRAVIKNKLRQNFDGKIVRKDLTKKIKEGANVPVYVLEFLLGQYCSSDDPEIIEELHDIWDDDFIPTTLKMKTDYSAYMKNIEDTEWCEVLKEIRRIIGSHQIKISEINGKSREALCYKEYRDENRQYNVIAVGGDKLSRGLTLEGLTVSFFMRSSMMYDTLMQMICIYNR